MTIGFADSDFSWNHYDPETLPNLETIEASWQQTMECWLEGYHRVIPPAESQQEIQGQSAGSHPVQVAAEGGCPAIRQVYCISG